MMYNTVQQNSNGDIQYWWDYVSSIAGQTFSLVVPEALLTRQALVYI
jgi:hypothetical protein